MTRVRRPALRSWRLFLATAAGVCALTSATSAQTATAPQIKGALLLNFVRFTEWSAAALPSGEAIKLCVVNDRTVGEAVRNVAKGRLVAGHALVVVTPKVEAVAQAGCHMVFSSGLDEARSRALIDSLATMPVLTVSDLDRFGQLGGVAQIFVQGGTVHFTINIDAAQRAGIRLSSKLLMLATIVKDDRDATR